jgi:gamma-glutamyltranspeptidase
MKARGGFITREDLTSYNTVERLPIRVDYRGWEMLGPPLPAGSGVHIVQMLNILEGYDLARKGYGTSETIHLLVEGSPTNDDRGSLPHADHAHDSSLDVRRYARWSSAIGLEKFA